MASFDVNMDAAIALTAKLERLHRSAFPVAVRGTLNRAALKAKKEMPNTAKKAFKRSNRPGLATFIRAFSTVDKATGFTIKTMKATVGINANKGSQIAEGMEKQEFGGTIKGRKLIPHDRGRTSGSYTKRLQKKYQSNKLDFVKGKSKGRTRKSNAVAKAIVAQRTGKMILQKRNKSGGLGSVFRIRSLSFSGNGPNRNVRFKVTPIYIYRRTKTSRVKASPFVKPAVQRAIKTIPDLYRREAEKQFKRLLK